MDSYRLITGMVFAVSLFLLVDAWVRQRAAPPPAAPATPEQAAGERAAPPTPTVPAAPPTPTQGVAPGETPAPAAKVQQIAGQMVEVRTDFLRAEIDATGGNLRRIELLQHRDRDDREKVLVLFEQTADRVYLAQNGLIGSGLPNHTSAFVAEAASYALQPGADSVVVRLRASGGDGVEVSKTFEFKRASYVIDVGFSVTNRGQSPIDAHAYYQLVRDAKPPVGDSKMVPTFSGVEIYTEKDKLSKIKFEDVAEDKASYPKTSPDGWVAIVQHYFLAAWLPPSGVAREFYLRPLGGGLIAAGVIVPMPQIAAGQSVSNSTALYVGPQEQERLKALAPGLELAVDYGWLRVLAVPLFWVLNKIYGFVGNWGVAIIILTIIIKIAFYPLSAASYRSMARMKVMAPKLQRLKERYGEDRQKMHQAMIELYKTEKINPLGGCLPIVVQIPVFIALYWVLLLSVELRHAPFALWIKDLSTPDPFYILPVLMGATMFIQTWLNPTPPDPMQARLMKIMPIAFSVFFFFFPSGLVLYWLVNNILSIAQQWQITRSLERSKPAHGES
ncbi:MAG TPA: membrane protein insertase YidC [Burkholderiales bacterium]|jgi:YidC/Oxa1 family membrane protein insertase